MPKRPNTPYKTKTQRVGWTRVLSPSSGGHSKMSPTSTLRGLGLGETPLRRWEAVTEMGRSQALIGSIATPSQRRTIDRGTTPRLTSVGYTDRCREEAIGSERRRTVVRITVELVEVTRQGRREGTRCRSDLIPPTKLKHKGWDGLGSSVRVRVGTARCHQPQRSVGWGWVRRR